MQTRARSQTNLRTSRLSMFQLQAEHQHAAGLIDLLFKGRVICHTSRLLTSASKNPLLRKHLYNEHLIIIILMPYKK